MRKSNKTNIEVGKDGNLRPLQREPGELCNARLNYGDGYCTNPAGFGTTHPGTGRCKIHGGASLGRPKKSFSVIEFDENEILKKLDKVADSDPSSISVVDNEITMLRSVFYRYMKACHDNGGKLPDPDDLKKFTDALAKMLDIKAKLELRSSGPRVTANVFIVYVQQINNILKRHIRDSDLLNRIADDLEGLRVPVVETDAKSE